MSNVPHLVQVNHTVYSLHPVLCVARRDIEPRANFCFITRAELGIRIAFSAVFGLGVVYFALVIRTLWKYGDAMDKTFRAKVDSWATEQTSDKASYRSSHTVPPMVQTPSWGRPSGPPPGFVPWGPIWGAPSGLPPGLMPWGPPPVWGTPSGFPPGFMPSSPPQGPPLSPPVIPPVIPPAFQSYSASTGEDTYFSSSPYRATMPVFSIYSDMPASIHLNLEPSSPQKIMDLRFQSQDGNAMPQSLQSRFSHTSWLKFIEVPHYTCVKAHDPE